jgi:hypothetical protein
MTLPLTSTGTGRGGNSVSGGDTAHVNEIMAPAAAVTPLDASSCIACMARNRPPHSWHWNGRI